MSERADEIFDDEGSEPIITTEGVSPEAPVAGEGPVRDDKGRFAAKGEAEAPEPTPEAAPPAAEVRERHDVPITALLDERDKRQKLEAELDRMRREMQAQRKPELPTIPDHLEDPEGFQRYVLGEQLRIRDDLEATFSERLARKEFGSEACDAALKAAQEAGEVRRFLTGPDRWERMVQWHQERAALTEIGSDPVAYRQKVRSEMEAELREQIKAELLGGSARPKPPPASLASASGAGVPPSGQEVIDPLFG